MARLPCTIRLAVSCLLSLASILVLADWIHASSSPDEASGSGSVLFLEGGTHKFLRPAVKGSDFQASTFSGSDVWSAVAVLLGIAPPLSMSTSSATKLDKLLFPDPFHRPRSVLALALPTLHKDVLKESLPNILGMSSYKLHPLTVDDRETTKVSGNDVRVKFLTTDDSHDNPDLLEHELDDLARILGGKYVDLGEGHVSIPLPTGSEYKLFLSKKGDRDLVLELINLVRSLKESLDAWKGLAQVSQIHSDLFLGTLRGVKISNELAGGSLELQASEIFLFLVSKIVLAMETSYEGKFVAVLVMPMETAKDSVEDILGIDLLQRTTRSLVEESSDTSDKVEKLTRNALTTVTALILIVAALLGSYFLFSMPLTRDTLLYSGAKLD
ncbi:hypothetical protein O6H91_12G025600 [Diphasiastrum complanatum]|uniref:Uncharacterized protein n=1 Tax=Diphasiastrum complanatum TaxID=34168 RepID=A0ACC2BZQ1_DIPCM|nr:hypothetical protein O6H91_12G025600 [Diphasiastrum complanatum]